MNKTIDLVIRITVPVPDDTTPEDHCAEAWEEERPLLAVPEPLAEHVEDFVRYLCTGVGNEQDAGVRLTLEPGREPGRPMTRAEADLFGAGVHAGMVLTMEASGLHETREGEWLTEMEQNMADYTDQDPEDYSEDEAARRLLRLIRCEWNGAHWITMTPGNELARQATLDAPKPWDHDAPWGVT